MSLKLSEKSLSAEYLACWEFCSMYYREILIVLAATVIMICAKSPDIVWFDSTHAEAFWLYGIIPFALLFLLGHRQLSSLAVGLGQWRFWLPASLLYLTIALPLVVLGTNTNGLNSYYQNTQLDWSNYLLTTSIYLLGWEYFFRGFLIAGLKKRFREGAILLQLIPFTLLHLGKPDIETFSCILSGLVWGYICYRANSFWPAFIMHLTVNAFTVYLVNG